MKQTNDTTNKELQSIPLANTSIAELLRLAQRLEQSRVLVAGDIMLDHYQYGSAERISPEAPVPVVKIEQEEYKLGGAGNVAQNLQALGAKPVLLTQAGQDLEAEQLKQLLRNNEIQHELLQSKCWRTTVKTRILAQGQQVVRVDKEYQPLARKQEKELSALLLQKLDQCPTMILSDYGKGCISPGLLKELSDRAPKHARVLLDPKEKNYAFYPGFFLMTPNRKEASWFSKLALTDQEEILAAGDHILAAKGCKNLLITLGPAGMVLFNKEGPVYKIPAVPQKVFDVTGAGDTVIAILAAALDVGGNLLQSCLLANAAAGLVVGQVGTAWVNAQDLQRQLQKTAQQIELEKWR